MVWFGWQPDVMPGNSRVTMTVPAARNADGSPITGIVRAELVLGRSRASRSRRSICRAAGSPRCHHASYPTASTDNRKPFDDGFLPTLTVRAKEQDAKVAIPNTEWSFGACPDGGARHRQRQADLLSGGLPARPALRADLSRQGPAGARPRLCGGARPRRVPEEPRDRRCRHRQSGLSRRQQGDPDGNVAERAL